MMMTEFDKYTRDLRLRGINESREILEELKTEIDRFLGVDAEKLLECDQYTELFDLSHINGEAKQLIGTIKKFIKESGIES